MCGIPAGQERVVIFTLEEQRYGIPLAIVERVVRMVEITPLPGVPDCIRGVINVQGRIMPVIDLRRRLGLTEREIGLNDQLLVTTVGGRNFALIADAAIDVCECRQLSLTDAVEILPNIPYLTGVAKLADGMILIHDPEKLVSPMELQMLDEMLIPEAETA